MFNIICKFLKTFFSSNNKNKKTWKDCETKEYPPVKDIYRLYPDLQSDESSFDVEFVEDNSDDWVKINKVFDFDEICEYSSGDYVCDD